jgi:hypothetical protein
MDPYRMEAIAYSLVMADELPRAQQAFERLMKLLVRDVPWQSEMLDRAVRMVEYLGHDTEGAKQQLVEWEQVSVANLRV